MQKQNKAKKIVNKGFNCFQSIALDVTRNRRRQNKKRTSEVFMLYSFTLSKIMIKRRVVAGIFLFKSLKVKNIAEPGESLSKCVNVT